MCIYIQYAHISVWKINELRSERHLHIHSIVWRQNKVQIQNFQISSPQKSNFKNYMEIEKKILNTYLNKKILHLNRNKPFYTVCYNNKSFKI